MAERNAAFNYRALKGRGLQMTSTGTNTGLRVRVVEITRVNQHLQASQPDVGRAVFVRMGRVAARLANEQVSRLPVCLRRVTALTASLRSVARVNLNELYSRQLRLVGKKSGLCT